MAPVQRCVSMAITQVLKKARRRHVSHMKIKPQPRYSAEMKAAATGYLCVHRLVRQAISKAKILAGARRAAAKLDPAVKKKRGHEYYQRHRDAFLEKCKARRHGAAFKDALKKRLLDDDAFYLNTKLRRRLHSALHVAKGKKRSRTMELVGCSYTELIAHLSSQLDEGETLHDKVIDHIFPMAKYHLADETQQRMCMHYTNLQLLSREDNARKHTALPTLDVGLRVERWAWPPGVQEEDLMD